MDLQSCLAARSSSSENQIVKSVSVVINALPFEKHGIHDWSKILEVILKKQQQSKHHLERPNVSNVSDLCMLKGCLCGIEEVRQALKRVFHQRTKAQFVPFDQDLYNYIAVNGHEEVQKIKNLCTLFEERDTEFGFAIEFVPKIGSESIPGLMSTLKSKYQVLEFPETDLISYNDLIVCMNKIETVSRGEVDLILDECNRSVKVVGCCSAVSTTAQMYEKHEKSIKSNDGTTLNTMSTKNLKNSCGLDDDDAHTRDMPEVNEISSGDSISTVNEIKTEETEFDEGQNDGIKSEDQKYGQKVQEETLLNISSALNDIQPNDNSVQKLETFKLTSEKGEFGSTINSSYYEKKETNDEKESAQKHVNEKNLKLCDFTETQNAAKICDKFDLENVFGEETRLTNDKDSCFSLNTEISGGEDDSFQSREHLYKCQRNENRNTTDTEQSICPLACDKARKFDSCTSNSDATINVMNNGCEKEGTQCSMENGKEPGTIKMIKSPIKNITDFGFQEKSASSIQDEAEINLLIKQEPQQITSETGRLDVLGPATSADVENSVRSTDDHHKNAAAINDQQQPFSKFANTDEFKSCVKEIPEVNRNFTVLNQSPNEELGLGYIFESTTPSITDENAAIHIDIQKSEASVIKQINRVTEEIDQRKNFQVDSSGNNLSKNLKLDADGNAMTIQGSTDGEAVECTVILKLKNENNSEEGLCNDECSRSVGEKIPQLNDEAGKYEKTEKMKEIIYLRQ